MVHFGRRVVVLFAIALFAPAVVLASHAEFVTIDIPGATATNAYGINPAGAIVGSYFAGGTEYGYLLRDGLVTTFAYPGAIATQAYGVNPQGDVVGQYTLSDLTVHGFLLPHDSDDFVPIDVAQTPGAGHFANTMPFKITPDGTIVGCIHDSDVKGKILTATMHGFAITPTGTVVDPAAGSMNLGMNSSGTLVGMFYVKTTPPVIIHSYLVENGVTMWLNYRDFQITRANDVNPSGTVVGLCRLSGAAPAHGFTYKNGTFELFDFPDAASTAAFSINPRGDIVGIYVAGGKTHGFLLTKRGN